MKNKAKDGGDLVWLYYVHHKTEHGDVLMITAAKDDDEVRSIFQDEGHDDGYHLKDLMFLRHGMRRFSRKIADQRISNAVRSYCAWGNPKPIYNI